MSWKTNNYIKIFTVSIICLLGFFTVLLILKNDTKRFSLRECIDMIDRNFLKTNGTQEKNIRVFEGTCSEEASKVGDHQRVVSYTFAKSSNNSYWIGFNEILSSISSLYPGWSVRIYATQEDIKFLKTKVNKTDILFYCDINNLPPPLNSVGIYPPRMWLFASIGDPQVDVAIFRDSDAEVLTREKDAVNEWLKSNKTLHIMRDHPYHKDTIMAGMFGLKMNEENRIKLQKLRNLMFCLGYRKIEKTTDQNLLKTVIWKSFSDDFIAHDSYKCEHFNGTSPWPTQREKLTFVGNTYYKGEIYDTKEECPKSCRPKDHQDWKHC